MVFCGLKDAANPLRFAAFDFSANITTLSRHLQFTKTEPGHHARLSLFEWRGVGEFAGGCAPVVFRDALTLPSMGYSGTMPRPKPAKRPALNTRHFGVVIALACCNSGIREQQDERMRDRTELTNPRRSSCFFSLAFLFTSRTPRRRIRLRFKWPGSYQHCGYLEIYMSDCPLVRHAENLKLLKHFKQTGKVAIPRSEWIRFFEALAFLNRDGDRLRIYCDFAGEYLLLSKTPIKWKPKKRPTQGELFER
jgi:hypothetical protein